MSMLFLQKMKYNFTFCKKYAIMLLGGRNMDKDFFPQNLKYFLDSGKISVKTILQITGNNSPGLVSMWKNGERQITTKDLVAIANFLNYTVDDLINKDLTNEGNRSFDELELLFSKNKDILTEDDKEMIKFLIEKRKKEIDKQLNEE